eukprot:SAG31_NODE_1073_length_10065_cov_2.176701_8_plen_433_part_00
MLNHQAAEDPAVKWDRERKALEFKLSELQSEKAEAEQEAVDMRILMLQMEDAHTTVVAQLQDALQAQTAADERCAALQAALGEQSGHIPAAGLAGSANADPKLPVVPPTPPRSPVGLIAPRSSDYPTCNSCQELAGALEAERLRHARVEWAAETKLSALAARASGADTVAARAEELKEKLAEAEAGHALALAGRREVDETNALLRLKVSQLEAALARSSDGNGEGSRSPPQQQQQQQRQPLHFRSSPSAELPAPPTPSRGHVRVDSGGSVGGFYSSGSSGGTSLSRSSSSRSAGGRASSEELRLQQQLEEVQTVLQAATVDLGTELAAEKASKAALVAELAEAVRGETNIMCVLLRSVLWLRCPRCVLVLACACSALVRAQRALYRDSENIRRSLMEHLQQSDSQNLQQATGQPQAQPNDGSTAEFSNQAFI